MGVSRPIRFVLAGSAGTATAVAAADDGIRRRSGAA